MQEMMKKCIVLFFLLCFASLFLSAQKVSSNLLEKAKQGDPEAMFAVGRSYFEDQDSPDYKESYKWLSDAASKGYAPAQAAVAYLLKEGLGVNKNITRATNLAKTASYSGDGLAYWVLAQLSFDSGGANTETVAFARDAFEQSYPFSKLLFAKLYSEGSSDFSISKNNDKALSLLKEVADYGDPFAEAFYGQLLRDSGTGSESAFDYLKRAADHGNAEAMAQVANMYYWGEGTRRSESDAFSYYKKASDAGSLLGKEGLADCYRLGIGTGGIFNERALNLYKELSTYNPRIAYLIGYYLNKGEGVARDTRKALSLLEFSASKGNAFAQAFLGIACFEGNAPFEEKDREKAFPYLNAALNNPDFDYLPVGSTVCEYVAVCKRYGLGTDMDVAEADRLRDKASGMKDRSSGNQVPFGLIGFMTSRESRLSSGLSWDSITLSDILKKVTFTYPKNNDVNESTNSEKVEQSKPVEEKKPAPTPKTPKAKSPKSGRLAVMIEAAPYCFAPSSVVSSRDGNTYWLKGSAIDVSASVGWLTNSGLFIGAGAGYEAFSGSRMSVIQGFVDARYFLGSGSGLFFGARGGVGLGSPEYGVGINAAGMLGYKISIGGNTGINIGLKAGINSFSDDNKTMGNVVGPFVGISF